MKIPRFYFLPEVAAVLRLNVKSVRRRIKSGKLKSVKEGGRVLVRESDLEQYLDSLERG